MLAINDNTGLAHIYGMHEGSGPVHYKRLVNGGMLDGQIAGMDFASLPPGSVIGMHEHIDNSEMWVVLDGLGHVQFEDTPVLMQAGQVLYTPAGGRHSMTNPADAAAPIEFVVVTMMSSTETPSAVSSSVVRPLDAGAVAFTGFGDDRYDVSLSAVSPGSTIPIHASTSQHLVYVVEGTATLAWGSVRSELERGSVIGIPSTEHVKITAGKAAGCRLLTVRIHHAAFAAAAGGSMGKPS